MITWIGRRTARGERGAQHVEAAVLISTLLVLGALVPASTTTLGQAVAQQWVCWTTGGGESCGGQAPTADSPADRPPPRNRAAVDDVTVPTTQVADPAVWHQPSTTLPANGPSAKVDGADVTMAQCDVSHCIATDGTLHSCTFSTTYEPVTGATTSRTCSPAIPTDTALTCTDEGRSPSTDTCRGPLDAYYHCTDPAADGSRTCRQTDTDADAHLASTPTSCDTTATDASFHITCLGPNGTLYQCVLPPYEGASPSCAEAGRAIDSTDVTDCVADPVRSSGVPSGGVEADAVVQCTYTPDTCFTEPTDGSTCAEQAVTVRCLVDASDPAGTQLQHCNSLGALIPPGLSSETVCVVEEAQGCVASTSVVTTPVIPPEQIVSTTQVGPLEVQVVADDTTTYQVPTGGTEVNGDPVFETMTAEQLTDFCVTQPQQCGKVADATVAAAETSFLGILQQTGLCADAAACQQELVQFAAASSPTCRDRCLLEDGRFTRLQLSSAGVAMLAAGIGVIGFFNEPSDARTALLGLAGSFGVTAAILAGLQTYVDNQKGAADALQGTREAARAQALAITLGVQMEEGARRAQENAAMAGQIAALQQQVAALQQGAGQPGGALGNLWNAVMGRRN